MGQVTRRGAVVSRQWGSGYWRDLGERVGSTFLGALLTLITMDNILEGPDWDTTLWPILVVPTLVSLLKGLLANMGNSSTGASLLPDPPGPVIDDKGAVVLKMSIFLALFFFAVAVFITQVVEGFIPRM